MEAYWWTVPYSNKIDCNWGAESLLEAGCQLTSDLVSPLVETICKRDLFFVVPGQKPDLDAGFQFRPRCRLQFCGVP